MQRLLMKARLTMLRPQRDRVRNEGSSALSEIVAKTGQALPFTILVGIKF